MACSPQSLTAWEPPHHGVPHVQRTFPSSPPQQDQMLKLAGKQTKGQFSYLVSLDKNLGVIISPHVPAEMEHKPITTSLSQEHTP